MRDAVRMSLLDLREVAKFLPGNSILIKALTGSHRQDDGAAPLTRAAIDARVTHARPVSDGPDIDVSAAPYECDWAMRQIVVIACAVDLSVHLLILAQRTAGRSLGAIGIDPAKVAAVVIGGTLLSGVNNGVFDGTLSNWWTKIVVGLLLFAFIVLHRIPVCLSARRAAGARGSI